MIHTPVTTEVIVGYCAIVLIVLIALIVNYLASNDAKPKQK